MTEDLLFSDAWPNDLSIGHRKYLADRGVSPQVAKARGYTTATTQSALTTFEFGKGSNPVKAIRAGNSAMVIPLYHSDSTIPSIYQARLDTPRNERGKPVKFEAPAGRRRGTEPGDLPSDVNPLAHEWALDSEVPLFITEGIPKGDAVLTAALREGIEIVPVSMTGVTMGFETKRDQDDVVVSREITDSLYALTQGREVVYLCWDSDWATKPAVRDALIKTGKILSKMVDRVIYLNIPPLEGANKTGVDDWLVKDGSTLRFLLDECQMESPDAKPKADEGEASSDDDYDASSSQVMSIEGFDLPIVNIDPDRLVMWTWENKKEPGQVKATATTKMVVLGAVPTITQIISTRRINDHLMETVEDSYVITVEWIDQRTGRRRSQDIDLLASELPMLDKWLTTVGALATIVKPTTTVNQRLVANTISAHSGMSEIETSVTTCTTGWYLNRSEAPYGWRYVHSDGWVGSILNDEGQRITNEGDSVVVRTESNAQYASLRLDKGQPDAADFNEWIDRWVMGDEINVQLRDERQKELILDGDKKAADVLSRRLSFGAMIVARSIIPGDPAKGTPMFVGVPGAGKTLMARIITSSFGAAYGTKVYASLGSTAAGVEVQVADARNMTVLLDDYRVAGSPAAQEKMDQIVDRMARGAYDGAQVSRSTRDLKAMAAPKVAGTVILTGEGLPMSSNSSNSTIQRLLVMDVLPATSPVFDMMDRLCMEPDLQRSATAWMIGQLAIMLDDETKAMEDAATADGEANVDRFVTPNKVTRSFVERLNEITDEIDKGTFSRVQMSPTETPNDRSRIAMRDMLVGGALIVMLAEKSGWIKKPRDHVRLVKRMCDVASEVLAQTARRVAETSPERQIIGLILSSIGSSAYLATPGGEFPTNPEAAVSWGWSKDEDRWMKRGDRIGYVTDYKGEIVLALDPTLVGRAIRSLSDASFNVKTIPAMLAAGRDEDGKSLLVSGTPENPLTRITVNNHGRELILVRPEVLGVKVTETAMSKEGQDY